MSIVNLDVEQILSFLASLEVQGIYIHIYSIEIYLHIPAALFSVLAENSARAEISARSWISRPNGFQTFL